MKRIPRIDGNLFLGPDGTVELLWDDIPFTDDEGDIIDMVVYLDSDNDLQCIERYVWEQRYTQEENPNLELDIEEVTYGS